MAKQQPAEEEQQPTEQPNEGTAEDASPQAPHSQESPREQQSEPTTAVARRPAVSIEEQQTMNAVSAWGRLMAASGFFRDAREPAQAAVKILVGRELGFGVTESMMGVHLIEGRPALGAGLMANAIKRSGTYDYRVIEHDNDHCEIAFFDVRHGRRDELGRSVFSVEDAERAGLVKPQSNWVKWPKNMVFARAMSNGVRFYCPDVFGQTVYTPEEIKPDIELSADGEIIDVEAIALPPGPPIDRERQTRQQRPQVPPDPPRDRSGGRSTGGGRSTRQGATGGQQQGSAGGRRAPARMGPEDWSKVVDVQTLMTWAFQAYAKQSADVFDVLEVGSTSDISAKFSSPEEYREGVLELLHEWDPVRYNTAMEEALGPADGGEDESAQSEYDADEAGPEDAENLGGEEADGGQE